MSDFLETQEQNISIFSHDKISANYKIMGELGRGGMGIVYKAIQHNPGREVAIKIIPRLKSQNSVKRFQREIKLTASLNHSYIAKVYDYIYDDNFLCLVMECIPGVSLNSYLNSNEINLLAKVQLFKAICSALLYAHENNIIHRDLKPANILVTTDGKPKIIDFGLARKMGSRFDLTKTGEVFGTPKYMAPEQVSGKNSDIDQQSDIYTLGAIFYEMITGEKMIKGESTLEVFYNIKYQDLVAPSEVNRNVHKEIDKVWNMAVARDKKERYQSIQNLIEDLDSFIAGNTITRNLTKKFNYTVIVLTCILLLCASGLFFLNQETKIDFQLGETETKILAYIDQGNDAAAIQLYKETKNIQYNNLLLNSIARCYSKMREQGIKAVENKNHDSAKQYLKIVLEAFPNDTETMKYLALAYLPINQEYSEAFEVNEVTREDMKKSQHYLEKCIALDPYTAEYFLILGKIEFSLGHYNKATQNLQQALELNWEEVEATALLFKIPHEEPSLQVQCYKYIFELYENFGQLKANLYTKEFKAIEQQYEKDYFQYITLNSVENSKLLKKHLHEIESYKFNTSLEDTLVVFRYAENFNQELQNNIKDSKFLKKIIDKAQNLKQEEYEKYCLYLLAYMYNHENWGQNFSEQEEQSLKKQLQKFIENDGNIFHKFLAVRAYTHRYGLIYILKTLQNDENILNKIIITAAIRQSGIFVPHHVYYKKEAISPLTQQEKDFLNYLIASTTYIYINDYNQDYKPGIKNNYATISEEDKQMLLKFSKDKDEKTKVSANISLLYLLDKQTDTVLFNAVETELIDQMGSTNSDVQNYLHFFYWRHPNTRSEIAGKYSDLYFKFLQNGDIRIKKTLLVLYKHYKNFLNAQFAQDGSDFILLKLLEQYPYTTKENKAFRLYVILALCHSLELQYADAKKYLESLSVFEKTYGYSVYLHATLSKHNQSLDVSIVNTINMRKQDIEIIKNEYAQCFNFYVFSLIRHHFLKNSLQDNVLQNVLYQLHREPNLGVANIVFPRISDEKRKKFAYQYFQHNNKNVRKYAKASYIAMLSNDTERDAFYSRANKSNNSEEKRAIALGFYNAVQKNVMDLQNYTFDESFHILFRGDPRQEYYRYITILKKFLVNNPVKSAKLKKWLVYANTLDPEESKYYFERAILAIFENNLPQALDLMKQAIKKGATETHLYFYYFEQAALQRVLGLHKEAIQSLNAAAKKINQGEFLIKIAELYLSLKEYKNAELTYNKFILHRKYDQKPMEKIGILVCYTNLNEKQIAKTMFYCINEVYKREEYNQKKFRPKVKVNGITSDVFIILEQKYPELKQLRSMGIFAN